MLLAAATTGGCDSDRGHRLDDGTNSRPGTTTLPTHAPLPGAVLLRAAAAAPPPTTLPVGIAVDRANTDAVARAATGIWFSWQPATDTGPRDAELRAAPLLDPGLTQFLRDWPAKSGPGARWLTLAAAHATVLAEVADNPQERPPDTATTAVRCYTVTQHITSAAAPPVDQSLVVGVTLTHRVEGWAVTGIQEWP